MFFIFPPEEFYLGQARVSASPERWLSSVCYTEQNTGWCWKKRIFWRKKEYFEGKKKKKIHKTQTQNGSHPSVTQNRREYFEIKIYNVQIQTNTKKGNIQNTNTKWVSSICYTEHKRIFWIKNIRYKNTKIQNTKLKKIQKWKYTKYKYEIGLIRL